MLKKYFYFIIFGLLALSTSCFAMSQEEKAIQDWEIVQKSYPQTTKFEKLADKKYHFINTGIGYDGELILKNVIIDKSEYENTKSAEFMVKLDKSDATFEKEENQSYSRWNYQTNTLLLNPKTNTWVRYIDYTNTNTTSTCSNSRKQKPVWLQLLINAFPILLIVGLLYFLGKGSIKNQESQLEQVLNSNNKLTNSNQQLADVLDKILIQLSEKNDDKKEEKG